MPLLWLSLSFFAGLLLASLFGWSGWLWLAVGIFCAWLPLWYLSRLPHLHGLKRFAGKSARLKLPPMLLLAALALGAWRYQSAQPTLTSGMLAALNDTGIYQITAIVTDPPDLRDQSTLLTLEAKTAARLDAQGHTLPAFPVTGKLQVSLPGRAEWQYGDQLTLQGQPSAPPNQGENDRFSYADSLSQRGIFSNMVYPRIGRTAADQGDPVMQGLLSLRQSAYAVIYALFPAPEAPLLSGILLGVDNDISADVMRAFQDTGTAHIIAISGFNIAILAALFSRMFSRLFTRWWAALLTVLAITFYSLLVGASPSVLRAAVMGCLALTGSLLGRRFSGWSGLNTLLFTAAIMCLGDPFLPWNISFQLSFGATLGLMLYADPLQNIANRLLTLLRLPPSAAQKIAAMLGEWVLLTLAAQIVTLPIMLYHFQRLSLSALWVNPLVLPAQPLLMTLSGLAVLVGLIWLPLARPIAWFATPLSTYTIHLIQSAAHLPGGTITLEPLQTLPALLLTAAVIAPGLYPAIAAQLPTKVKTQLSPYFWMVVTGLAAAFVLRIALITPDSRLHLTLFDQSSVPVLLLQTPSGGQYLIDAGPSANRISAALGEKLNPLDHHLDGIFITRCDTESLQSMTALVARFPIHQAWWTCSAIGTRAYTDVIAAFSAQGIRSYPMSANQSVEIEKGIQVESLANDAQGGALALRWQNFCAVLPGSLAAPPTSLSPSILILDGLTFKLQPTFTPADVHAVGASTVLVTNTGHPPLDLPGGWLQTQIWQQVTVSTDGLQMWLEMGSK